MFNAHRTILGKTASIALIFGLTLLLVQWAAAGPAPQQQTYRSAAGDRPRVMSQGEGEEVVKQNKAWIFIVAGVIAVGIAALLLLKGEGSESEVFAQGQVTIAANAGCDADLGAQVGAADTTADFVWEVNGAARQLVPKNGAQFKVVGIADYDYLTLPQLEGYTYSTATIDQSQIGVGVTICVQTNGGHYTKMRVEAIGDSLTLKYYTFNIQ